MSDIAQNVSGNQGDDDPMRELLVTCDRSPHEGLEWIDRLDTDLRSRPPIMFARFTALRHLALDGFFGEGAPNLGSVTADEIRRIMTAEKLAYAEQALAQVAKIDAAEPEYIDNLGDEGDKFASRMVDDICIVIERLQPGKVQDVLGWTKLHYFGSERLGKVPTVFDERDDGLISGAIRTRIYPPQTARSALSYKKGEDNRNRRFLDVFLMEKSFRDTPTMGDANMFCSVRFFDDGEVITEGGGSNQSKLSGRAEAHEDHSTSGGEKFPDGANIVLNERANWSDHDLSEMARELPVSLIRPVLNQVDALGIRTKNKLGAARELLEGGQKQLSEIGNAIEKLRSSGYLLNEKPIIERLLSTAVGQSLINERQQADILVGFQDGKVIGAPIRKMFNGFGAVLDDISFMAVAGLIVVVVGFLLSLFIDTAMFVIILIVAGAILFAGVKYSSGDQDRHEKWTFWGAGLLVCWLADYCFRCLIIRLSWLY